MLKKIFSSELGRGAFILFITINIFNLFNFLFHFSMGRLLGPSNYGILAVLMSLIYIYNIPSEAIQNIISRYTSKFNVKKEYGKIKTLMFEGLFKGITASVLAFFLLVALSIFLSPFLGINFWLLFLTDIFIFFSILLPIVRGTLQGRKKFSLLGTSMILESGFKLFFAVSAVIIGLKVFGAIIGVLLGILFAFIFSFYFNKDILKSKKQETSFKEIYPKSIPYFTTMFVIFLIFSLDIILAKRFFSPELAGKYAVLSMLGKMFFFGTVAISKAMFPLTSEKHDSKKDSKKLFKKSFLIVSSFCLIGIIIYGLLPEIIIGVLYGAQYLEMSPYLIYSGLAFSFLSLSNLILIYGLSTNKLKNFSYLNIFLILEITLLFLFHKSILEYTLAFMVSNIIIFICSFFFIKK